MKITKIIVVLIIIISFSQCKIENDTNNKLENKEEEIVTEKDIFPKVKSLENVPLTDFTSTLETKFETSKNNIYAATLLMAWDEVREVIQEPITSIEGKSLENLNNSTSFKDVLKSDEFDVSTSVQDRLITAKAYFKKSLPFDLPFSRSESELKFEDEKVASFGFYGNSRNARIIYYNNDDDFSIKLLPEDREHEIILMKSNFGEKVDFATLFEVLNLSQQTFIKNKTSKNEWKYNFDYEYKDEVHIPILKFNVEHNYPDLLKCEFKTANRFFRFEKVHQSIAFVLNEVGAEVESVSVESIEELSEGVFEEEEEIIQKPKIMKFDKSYVIFLKRKDAENPYFAMFVSNTEFMELVK